MTAEVIETKRTDGTFSGPGEVAWLRCLWVSGSVATAGYVSLIFVPGPTGLLVAIAFAFAAGLSVGSVAIWQALAPRSVPALLAAVSNTIAGALLVSMVVVQLAVKDARDPPEEDVRAVYWGLDVAWDLYLGAGTLVFALVFWRLPRFGWLSLPGLVVAILLIVLNLIAFPEPPSSAGLVDVGPLVGLWYSAITVRGFLLWRERLRAHPPD